MARVYKFSRLLSLVFVVSVAAHADTVLLPASGFVQILLGSTVSNQSGLSPYYGLWNDDHLSQPVGSNGTVSATGGTLSGGPAVRSDLIFSGVPNNQLDHVNTQVTYQFAIDGPDDATVQVDFATSGWATVSSISRGSYSYSRVLVYQPGGDGSSLLDVTACAGDLTNRGSLCGAGAPSVTTASFNVDRTLSLQTNTVYQVDLWALSDYIASTIFNPPPFTNYRGSAQADPTITLDTSDQAYSLVFSDGIANSTAAAPEPSTIAMFGTGLLGLAGAARRRMMV